MTNLGTLFVRNKPLKQEARRPEQDCTLGSLRGSIRNSNIHKSKQKLSKNSKDSFLREIIHSRTKQNIL